MGWFNHHLEKILEGNICRDREPVELCKATPPPAVEEAQIRKLFELLDGKSKGEARSQRRKLQGFGKQTLPSKFDWNYLFPGI